MSKIDDTPLGRAARPYLENLAGMEKLLPQNLEAEAGVLGSLLIDPSAIGEVVGFLKADDFYREAHREIYQAIVDLGSEGIPADLITLGDELARRGKLDDLGGLSYVSSLANQVPTSANVEYYGHIVERTSILRRLIQAGGQIAAVAYNEPDALVAIEQSEKIVFDVASRLIHSADVERLERILDDATRELDEIHRHSGDLTGTPTGMRDLDKMTGGLQRSDLILLAARPAVGKTSLALSMALESALKHKQRVLVFSLEMSKRQIAQRLMAMQAGVDLQHMRLGRMNDNDWSRVVEASAALSEIDLYVDDSSTVTLPAMRAKARRLKAELGGLDLIIVDYLQLMGGIGGEGEGRRQENRVQEVSAISRGLKILAKELDVPVLALSQLSRAVEMRSDKKPMLSDLRESGTLEQDSDVVMFIYRDEVYNPETMKPNIADLIIAKHRNGPTGEVNLYFQAAHTRYRTLDLHDGYAGAAKATAPAASYARPYRDDAADAGDETWYRDGQQVSE